MKKKRQPAILVFGEDDTDRKAISELVRAIRSDAPKIERRRKPLILMKGRSDAAQSDNAEHVAKVVAADSVRFDVRLVLAHQDCDAIEPAHEDLSLCIEKKLADVGAPVIAVTPAFEMEAWWWLWPDALLAVNSKWRRPKRRKAQVGRIENAKEALIRDLRPKEGATRDYRESDAPLVAAQVREQQIVDRREAQSASFDRFQQALKEIPFPKP